MREFRAVSAPHASRCPMREGTGPSMRPEYPSGISVSGNASSNAHDQLLCMAGVGGRACGDAGVLLSMT